MFGQANNDYNTLNFERNLSESQARQVSSSYAQAAARLERIVHMVENHEAELNIETQWTPETPEYKTVLVELYLREYRQALDHLEYLVVQRMFELSKLGMSGVGGSYRFVPYSLFRSQSLGYKMRQKIGNALRARSEAIKKALKEYNRLAANLHPPREQLTWSKVIEMATVGDLDLLRHARQDIRDQPWA
jgi:hypothetical protein